MSSSPPASVTAVLAAACGGLDRPVQQHSVWIHRDGSVTTPDHANSTAENVASALGDHTAHICAYWDFVPVLLAQSSNPVQVPSVKDWRLSVRGMWSQRAVWTVLSGLLGRASHMQADPETVLGYVAAYQDAGGVPSDPETQITYLLSPWMRDGGWRRRSQVSPAELADLLDAGIPMDRAASAAALNISAKVAAESIPQLRSFGLPADVLLPLAYALSPESLPSFLGSLDPEAGRTLPARLATLKEALRSDSVPGDQIEQFLRSAF